MERQQLLALHLRKCWGCMVTSTYNRMFGRLSWLQRLRQHRYHIPKITVNGASTIISLASRKMLALYGDINP
jgi:hypothetical protein